MSSMSKRAIITGITGQDGSYLAELLLDQGYEVVGVTRRLSAPNHWRIEHLLDRIKLRQGDLLDQLSLIRVIDEVRPHEIYNLAAMSFVPASWDQPMLTGEYDAQGVTRVLEAIRQVDTSIKIYQASSSEMFGKVRETPQSELLLFILVVRMVWRSRLVITSRLITGKVMICLQCLEFFLIMSRLGADLSL